MLFKNNLIYLLLISLSALSCKKDKQGIEALPAATQEGKGTFGCLINGKAFLPKTSGISPGLSAYWYRGNDPLLSIYAPRSKNNQTDRLALTVSQSEIEQNVVYKLGNESSIAFGRYTITVNSIPVTYLSTSNSPGELYITKIDKNIVSGTFWFDGISETGERLEIREGRFDIHL